MVTVRTISLAFAVQASAAAGDFLSSSAIEELRRSVTGLFIGVNRRPRMRRRGAASRPYWQRLTTSTFDGADPKSPDCLDLSYVAFNGQDPGQGLIPHQHHHPPAAGSRESYVSSSAGEGWSAIHCRSARGIVSRTMGAGASGVCA